MKTIEQIIKMHGGFRAVMDHHISIENEPFTRLVVEIVGGPKTDLRSKTTMWKVSVAHYSEQNGDAMRDPEMCFWVMETDRSWTWVPCYFRNDYVAAEQIEEDVLSNPRQSKQLSNFAAVWDRNLAHQKFLDAYRLKFQPANPQPAKAQ